MVFDRIRAILAEQFSEDESGITLNTNLADDLGADSLDMTDLVMAIEDEFEIEVPEEAAANIKTVADVVSFIEDNI
ncbi:MAG: acyl carrier protein [Clostridia bacterium]|nr:acyl carrier protein [Clostridia bacterium]MBQ2348311.1 acyl carrier protein [Clostridia bacterium]